MPRYSPYVIFFCLLILLQIPVHGKEPGGVSQSQLDSILERAYHLISIDSESALEQAEAAANISEESNWKNQYAQSQHIIGRVHFQRGDLEKSLYAHKLALETYRELSDEEMMARSYNNLGLIANQLEDKSIARVFFGYSLQLRKGNEPVQQKASAYSFVSLAENFAIEGQIDSAQYYLDKALLAARESGELEVVAFVHEHIGQLKETDQRPGSALHNYGLALNLLKEQKRSYNYLSVLLGLQRCSLITGQGKPEIIAEELEEVSMLARVQNWSFLLLESHRLLAQCYSRTGQHEMAVFQYEMREKELLNLKSQQKNVAGRWEVFESLIESIEVDIQKSKGYKNLSSVLAFMMILMSMIGFAIYSRYVSMKADRNRFKSRQKEAEAKSTRMQEFTTTVSHDIKEPIRSVSHFLELLKRDNLIQGKTLMSELYVEAKKQVDDLDQFLKDLEDYFGLSGGKMELELVNMEDVIDTVRRRLSARITETHTELDVSPMPIVYSQPTLLKLILQNLISNAIKFQAEGNRPEIQVGANIIGEKLSISVKDNGIGIPEQYHSGIFHALNRGNSYSYPGTGMGLAIVAKAISILKGRINVYSNPKNGTGTIFLIELPLIQEPTTPSNQYLSVESIA